MIYQDGEHTALRSISQDVPKEMFGTEKLKNILNEMFETLSHEPDGVAIAAPQIGIPYNIFVVSRSIEKFKAEKNFIFINPKITTRSQEKKYMEEGCLSVRWLYGKVYRHTKVTVKARDETGVLFQKKVDGLFAHICQHEIDHLHGTLFIDSAIDVHELDDETISKIKPHERTHRD